MHVLTVQVYSGISKRYSQKQMHTCFVEETYFYLIISTKTLHFSSIFKAGITEEGKLTFVDMYTEFIKIL